MILSFIPILAVDVLGSVAMVVIALLSLYKARMLREMDTDNAVFLYLLWISMGFTVFAVSRSFGHILKQFLILTSHPDTWYAISSYSGSVNTVTFMLVGLITLFFNQNWYINEKIFSSRQKLEITHIKLMDLNQTLEQKVIERTKKLTKNVSEKRQMEQQIAQADKLAALGELSAGVAHEINNPLGIILGYTQLLLKLEPEHTDDLKIIEKHVQNCKTVVSDLLSFSRKGSTEMGVVDINKVVGGVINFLSNHMDFRNIEITLNPYTGNRLNVIGNEQELSQVMVNMLINACHAVDKKGKIDITTLKTENNNILIRVKDNGTGVEKKNLSRIFDPFFTTKPVGQGTGLGLSVGYGIIKRHRGDIKVQSSMGKGTVFTISLPADTTQT